MICGYCNCHIVDYGDVGYDGPANAQGRPMPDNEECIPHGYYDWLLLCAKCAKQYPELEDYDD